MALGFTPVTLANQLSDRKAAILNGTVARIPPPPTTILWSVFTCPDFFSCTEAAKRRRRLPLTFQLVQPSIGDRSEMHEKRRREEKWSTRLPEGT